MLAELRLKHYRSYTDESFEFDDGVNIIVGPNASGKTNLLEAILVLACGTSYRAKDAELVQFGEPWLRLTGRLPDGGERTLKITTEPEASKQFEINGKLFKRLALPRTMPVVLFEPNHLQLLSAGPEQRRVYLDDILEQTTPGFGSLRRQYKRSVSQRNALLKHGEHTPSAAQLFPWDVRLSELGARIARLRAEIVSSMQRDLPGLYEQLAGIKTVVELQYLPQFPIDTYETAMLHQLENSRELDRLRGFTAYGPHREDVQVLFGNHAMKDVASRGETRTVMLAIKILELQIVEVAREELPLLLLDDVFSELDGKRRHALTDHLKRYQTFITTTDADLVLQNFANSKHVISLVTTDGGRR